MTAKKLTDSELLVLGLLSEMPRHGYDLEKIIEQRGMREWTQIGFSSIYYVLGKLESSNFVKADTPLSEKAKKRYKLTRSGKKALVDQTQSALKFFRSSNSSLLMGMIHWSVLSRDQALSGLKARQVAVTTELDRLQSIQLEQQPLPDFVDAMFEFNCMQLITESKWIAKTLEYMKTKTWDS